MSCRGSSPYERRPRGFVARGLVPIGANLRALTRREPCLPAVPLSALILPVRADMDMHPAEDLTELQLSVGLSPGGNSLKLAPMGLVPRRNALPRHMHAQSARTDRGNGGQAPVLPMCRRAKRGTSPRATGPGPPSPSTSARCRPSAGCRGQLARRGSTVRAAIPSPARPTQRPAAPDR